MEADPSVSDDISNSCSQSNISTLLKELGNDTIQYGSTISLSQTDFKSLMSPHRMTSSIIDAYLTLISNRSKEKGFPTVYCFDTVFGASLLEKGPNEIILLNSLHNLNLHSYNFLLVPFWCINYWMMFLVNNVHRKIMFYDIGNRSELAIDCLQNLLQLYHTTYLENYKNKGSITFNSPFKNYMEEREAPECLNIPAAMRFSDSDVLVLVFAELISKSLITTRNFKIIDCEYYRRKITYELLTSKLLYEDSFKNGEPKLLVEVPQSKKCPNEDTEPSIPESIPEFFSGETHIKSLLSSDKLTLLDLLCDRTEKFWIKRPPE